MKRNIKANLHPKICLTGFSEKIFTFIFGKEVSYSLNLIFVPGIILGIIYVKNNALIKVKYNINCNMFSRR